MSSSELFLQQTRQVEALSTALKRRISPQSSYDPSQPRFHPSNVAFWTISLIRMVIKGDVARSDSDRPVDWRYAATGVGDWELVNMTDILERMLIIQPSYTSSDPRHPSIYLAFEYCCSKHAHDTSRLRKAAGRFTRMFTVRS